MNNGELKSQESIMLNLTDGLLEDLRMYHLYSFRERDREIDFLRARTAAEGPGFLTKTLPLLGKALDQALKTGAFTIPWQFKHAKGSKLPRFLRRLFENVFNTEGELRDSPCVASIKDIRQVAYVFYKYELPYEEKLVKTTVADFVEVDQTIRPLSASAEVQGGIYYGQKVIGEILKDFLPSFGHPANGPGSVANGIPPNARFRPTRFYPRLSDLCGYDRLYFFNDRHLFDRFEGSYFALPQGTDGTARLIAVPKDSRGPRLISSEPSEFMTYQQALRRELVPLIERHPLTCQQVNFTDQTINGKLALDASIDGSYATLDLAQASDRLSLDLVEGLFEGTSLEKILVATRSTYTSIDPGYGTVERIMLRKFAPMGSALCFPIQALSFFALIVGRMMALGESLTTASHRVWVYGDDIIVPTEFAHEAIDVLESVGLKVNEAKSCYSGHFRESCGVDAFKGVDITPVKLKKVWEVEEIKSSKSAKRGGQRLLRPTATTTISWVAISNNLFWNGYWTASAAVKDLLLEWLPDLPVVTQCSPAIGFETWSSSHVFEANTTKWKWHADLQCFYLPALVASTGAKRKYLHGWECLLRLEWNRSIFQGDHQQVNYLFPVKEALTAERFTDRYTVKLKRTLVTENFL